MTPAAARALFRSERAKFAEHFPWIANVKLVIVDRRCPGSKKCRFRDLALADLDTFEVVLARRALDLPRDNIVGLLRHELGHHAEVDPVAKNLEQRADDHAEYVTNEKIRYDDRDVQTVGRGRWPRPKYLHR